MKLILLRHGMTMANERHLYCGFTDLPLSVAGTAALKELKQTVLYPDIAGMRILTSGMKRCDETLSILYGDISRETASAFREMNFGAFEMRSYEQMKEDPDYIAWISGDNEANITPGGESGNLMKARVLSALDSLLSDRQDTLLVTHGGVIAAIMERLFPAEGKSRYQWQPSPGRGYLVDIDQMSYHMI